jgi:hypothetical protein
LLTNGKARAKKSNNPRTAGVQKRKSATKKRPNVNLKHLFSGNLIGAANANVETLKNRLKGDRGEIQGGSSLTFSAKNKDDAIRQMMNQVSDLDSDTAAMDKRAIGQAGSYFTRRTTADGAGGWHVPGMKTGLFPYQYLGTAFMV